MGDSARTFLAVLGALLVFGLIVLGYQAVSGPSDEECYSQQIADAINKDSGGIGLSVDEDC